MPRQPYLKAWIAARLFDDMTEEDKAGLYDRIRKRAAELAFTLSGIRVGHPQYWVTAGRLDELIQLAQSMPRQSTHEGGNER